MRDAATTSAVAGDQSRRHYARPPVLEAVVDIHAELPESIALDVLATFQSGEESRYPERRPQYHTNVAVADPTGVPSVVSQEQTGYAFVSATKSEVAMVRRSGFSLSKLPPYQRWESFRDEARRLWERYVEIARPLRVSRAGVRYINRLEIPFPVGELRDYLRTLPEISPAISQRLSRYVMHLELPQPDMENGIVILNEAIVDAHNSDALALVLDIDVVRGVDLAATSGQLWEIIEQLRDRERTIFEASITDRTRELFE